MVVEAEIERSHRLLRGIALMLAATVIAGAGWSSVASIAVGSGSWSGLGGVTSGLQLWLDAGESATLLTTSRVRMWFDKSLAERDARPIDLNNAPIFGSNGGYAEAVFTGTALSAAAPLSFEPLTFAIVLRIGVTTGLYPIVGNHARGTGIIISFSKVRLYVNDVLAASATISPATGRIILFVRMVAGGSDYASVNGGSELAVNLTSTEPLDLIGGIYLSGVLRTLTGGISEIAVWNRALSSAERTTVTRALGAKWGISVP